MKKRTKKAQTVLEYVLIITGVIILVIFAARQWISPAVTEGLTDSNTAINNVTGAMPSHPTLP